MPVVKFFTNKRSALSSLQSSYFAQAIGIETPSCQLTITASDSFPTEVENIYPHDEKLYTLRMTHAKGQSLPQFLEECSANEKENLKHALACQVLPLAIGVIGHTDLNPTNIWVQKKDTQDYTFEIIDWDASTATMKPSNATLDSFDILKAHYTGTTKHPSSKNLLDIFGTTSFEINTKEALGQLDKAEALLDSNQLLQQKCLDGHIPMLKDRFNTVRNILLNLKK